MAFGFGSFLGLRFADAGVEQASGVYLLGPPSAYGRCFFQACMMRCRMRAYRNMILFDGCYLFDACKNLLLWHSDSFDLRVLAAR